MAHQRECADNLNNVKMLSPDEAARYLGLGRLSARKFAEECGAVIHYGRRVLIDRMRLDQGIEALRKSESEGEDE